MSALGSTQFSQRQMQWLQAAASVLLQSRRAKSVEAAWYAAIVLFVEASVEERRSTAQAERLASHEASIGMAAGWPKHLQPPGRT